MASGRRGVTLKPGIDQVTPCRSGGSAGCFDPTEKRWGALPAPCGQPLGVSHPSPPDPVPPLTHSFPHHEDKADAGGQVELPACPLLLAGVAVAPLRVAVPAAPCPQLQGGRLSLHRVVPVLLHSPQVGPVGERGRSGGPGRITGSRSDPERFPPSSPFPGRVPPGDPTWEEEGTPRPQPPRAPPYPPAPSLSRCRFSSTGAILLQGRGLGLVTRVCGRCGDPGAWPALVAAGGLVPCEAPGTRVQSPAGEGGPGRLQSTHGRLPHSPGTRGAADAGVVVGVALGGPPHGHPPGTAHQGTDSAPRGGGRMEPCPPRKGTR